MNLYDKVYNILKLNPIARNCDKALISLVWKTYYSEEIFQVDGKNCIKLESLQKLPFGDNITRARRKIQEGNEFLPTKISVVRNRKINEELWRRAMAKNDLTFFN